MMVPVKLGCLLKGGYMDDWAVLYCPSGSGMKSPWLDNCNSLLQRASAIKRVATSRNADGLFFGKYGGSWDSGCNDDKGSRMTVRGQYNYRPSIVLSGDWQDWPCMSTDNFYLPGTTPREKGYMGAQEFATQKKLGGRALICDTFERGEVTASHTFEQIVSGLGDKDHGAAAGLQCHRDGYNVLYGDYHAAWYGDPQQQIIWYPIGTGAFNTKMDRQSDVASMHSSAMTWEWCYSASKKILGESHEVWHWMDNAAGVDVDVAYSTPGDYDTYWEGKP